MNKLAIEFTNEDNLADNRILINGKNFGDKYRYSDNYNCRYLSIYDKNIFEELKKYKIYDIMKFCDHFYYDVRSIDLIDIRIEITTDTYYLETDEEKHRIIAILRYEPEDWNKILSIRDYANLFFEKVKLIPNAVEYHEPMEEDEETGKMIYSLLNGFGLALDIDDTSLTLEKYYSKIYNLCRSLDSEVEREILSIVDKSTIERCIEFTPEYYQAGLDILNYFGTYFKTQYPDEKATVRIEQQDLKVIMTIKTEEGETEIIEKALHEYELILSGSEKPEKFIENDKLIYELRNELRIAKFRLESQQDMITLQNKNIDGLVDIISKGLSQTNQVNIDFKPKITLSNNITLNQNISSVIGNISELIESLSVVDDSYNILLELKKSFEDIEEETEPDIVRKSSAMRKFERFIKMAGDRSSKINKIFNDVESGWEILSELGEKYNKIAVWCGLPSIPSIFIKKK